MGETHDSDKIATILEAARKRFGHYGLAKTTMTEIAADIGMSKASLYYYFPDKENLFGAVIEKEMEGFFIQMEKVMSETVPASQKLKHYVDVRFAFFLEFLNLSKLTSHSADSIKPISEDLHKRFQARETKILNAILHEGVKQKEFLAMDTMLYAGVFHAVMQGLRMVSLKYRDTYLLTEEDNETLRLNQINITKIFIKGISRTIKK